MQNCCQLMFWCSKTSCSIFHKKDASNGPQRCRAYQTTKYGCLSIVYRCDCRYVGRTSQRLQDNIKQHIPKAIRNQTQPDRDLFQSNPTSTSAIGQHLLKNEKCVSYYDDNQFSILAKGRKLFHLSTVEATLIKMLKPELWRQNSSIH